MPNQEHRRARANGNERQQTPSSVELGSTTTLSCVRTTTDHGWRVAEMSTHAELPPRCEMALASDRADCRGAARW